MSKILEDIEFKKIVKNIEMRSILDINGWRELSRDECLQLSLEQINNLLGLCPKDFIIEDYNKALLDKKELELKFFIY